MSLRPKQPKPWTEEEVELLRIYYPRLPQRDLLDLFNNKRDWMEFFFEAEKLGVKRLVEDYKKQKRPSTTIGKEKLRKLLDSGKTVSDIAEKLKSTPEIVRRNIQRWGL